MMNAVLGTLLLGSILALGAMVLGLERAVRVLVFFTLCGITAVGLGFLAAAGMDVWAAVVAVCGSGRVV